MLTVRGAYVALPDKVYSMNKRTRFILLTFQLLPFGGLALAAERTEPYRYGDRLDIARVLRIEQPPTELCEVVDETLVYLDSTGVERRSVGRALSKACQYH